MPAYMFLGLALVPGVIATSALKAAEGFTRLGPSVLVVVGYGAAFFLLSLTLKTIPVGIAYAIWSGAGIVLVSLISFFLYRQALDLPALVGMGLIIVGVIVINAFSQSSAH